MGARASVDELTNTVVAVVAADYAALGTSALYQLLADVTAGKPAGLADPLAHDFVADIASLIEAEYSHLSAGEVTVALGRVAQEVDRLRRATGLNSGAARRVMTSASGSGASPVVVPASQQYVRDPTFSYVAEWAPSRSLLTLRFESDGDLWRFAAQVVATGHFEVPLAPAPPRLAALAVDLATFGAGVIGRVAAAATEVGGERVICALTSEGPIRALAARHREAVSSSHHRVETPGTGTGDFPTVGWGPERPAAGTGSHPTQPAVAPERPPATGSHATATGSHATATGSHATATGSHPFAHEPSARRRDAVAAAAHRQAEHRAFGGDPSDSQLPSDFSREPSAVSRVGSGSATNPGFVRDDSTGTAARRRAVARARAHTITGSTARVTEDELRRFGRETGRRAATGSVSVVPGLAEPDDVSSHDAPPSPRETIADALARGLSAPHLPTPAATGAAPPTFADPFAVGNDELGGALGSSSAVPTFTVVASAPAAPETRRAPIAFTEEDGLRLGALIARRAGAGSEGGVPSLVLQTCGGYPASILEVATGTRHWRVALREDSALDVRVSPEPREFSFHNLVAASGLVDAAALSNAVAEARSGGSRLSDVLVRSQLLRFRQLDAIVQARAGLMLRALLAEPVVSFEVRAHEAIEAPGTTPIQIAPSAWSALLAHCDAMTQEALERLLESHHSDRPSFVATAFIGASGLRLDSRQRRFVEQVLVGDVGITQGLAQSPLRRRPSLALLVALDLAGLVHWERSETSASRIGRVWPAIVQKQRDVVHANPFELLEAHWSADGHLVQEAFQAELRNLDLEYVIHNGTAEQQAGGQATYRALVAARDALQDPAVRRARREQLVDDFNRRAAVQLYEKQAELALFKGDYAAATDALRRVVELAPRHPSAGAQLRAILGG
ncbi:MAG: hypothetical protein H6700_09845 [Myxococcales bacterium]|nr:hypothetical protein [Myxococcales bacterium]MCB9532056.1 hypothetical protein [Myxococcales bacterium]